MTSHLIFISLLLGLVSGKQPVDLQADDTVKSIRIVLAGQEIARLTQPPWHAEIDLGANLVPRELDAVGYDANGNEVGRASQLLNLPRPRAEVEIAIDSAQGFPTAVQLHWRNVDYAKPDVATVTLDNATLTISADFRAAMPKIDWTHPHVLAAEMKFAGGTTARREVVLDGATFSDVANAELTPVLVRDAAGKGCFSIDGSPIAAVAVEKPEAHVIFVRDPDAKEAINALDPRLQATNPRTRAEVSSWVRLEKDTVEQIQWPIATQVRGASEREWALLFRHTGEMEAQDGLMGILAGEGPFGAANPRRYADAVAVAGVSAMSDARRRAVILMVSKQYPDSSDLTPRSVRKYLQSIGVPFFVWSLTGPRPDLAESWGAVEDISSLGRLRAATMRLREELGSQRIAWIRTDALDALRVKAERCGDTTVAH